MNKAIFFVLMTLTANAYAEEGICPKILSHAVEAKLTPVLLARNQAAKKNDWWDKHYEKEIDLLFNAKDKASSEARVALMDYYIGEAYGEDLVCAVALDKNVTTKLLELYEECDIQPKQDLGNRMHSSTLRNDAKRIIMKGNAKESCTYD